LHAAPSSPPVPKPAPRRPSNSSLPPSSPPIPFSDFDEDTEDVEDEGAVRDLMSDDAEAEEEGEGEDLYGDNFLGCVPSISIFPCLSQFNLEIMLPTSALTATPIKTSTMTNMILWILAHDVQLRLRWHDVIGLNIVVEEERVHPGEMSCQIFCEVMMNWRTMKARS
jgi:hypothetical protein